MRQRLSKRTTIPAVGTTVCRLASFQTLEQGAHPGCVRVVLTISMSVFERRDSKFPFGTWAAFRSTGSNLPPLEATRSAGNLTLPVWTPSSQPGKTVRLGPEGLPRAEALEFVCVFDS